MKKIYWVIITTIVLFSLSSKYTLSLVAIPSHTDIYCEIDKEFLIANNISLNRYEYNFAKNATEFKINVIIYAEEGFLVFYPIESFGNDTYAYYNNSIDDTKFYFINNLCKEGITPILNLMKQKNITHHECEFHIYSKTTEDAKKNLGYYTEKVDNWLMSCRGVGSPVGEALGTIIGLTLVVVFIFLFYIAPVLILLVIIVILYNKYKKKVKKK